VKWKIQLGICGQITSVCNSEIIIKIGQYLRKLCFNEKGSSFLLSVFYYEIFLDYSQWLSAIIINILLNSYHLYTDGKCRVLWGSVVGSGVDQMSG